MPVSVRKPAFAVGVGHRPGRLFYPRPSLRFANKREADVALYFHGVGAFHLHVARVGFAGFGVIDFAVVPLIIIVILKALHENQAQAGTATELGVGVLRVSFGFASGRVIGDGQGHNFAAEVGAALVDFKRSLFL